jgi:hypothetical protein
MRPFNSPAVKIWALAFCTAVLVLLPARRVGADQADDDQFRAKQAKQAEVLGARLQATLAGDRSDRDYMVGQNIAELARLGEPAIAPLSAATKDEKYGRIAIYALAGMLDYSGHWQSLGRAAGQVNANDLKGPPLLALEGAVAPAKKWAADPSVDPLLQQGRTRYRYFQTAPVGLLIILTPRLRDAGLAVVDLVKDRQIPDDLEDMTVAALSRADPAVKKALTLAAGRNNPAALAIYNRVKDSNIPPAAQATKILAKDAGEQFGAVQALPRDASTAEVAVQIFANEKVEPEALQSTLRAIGPPAMPAIQKGLFNANPRVRVYCAEMIPVERLSSTEIQKVVDALGTPDLTDHIQKIVVKAVPSALPLVLAKLKSPDVAVRLAACDVASSFSEDKYDRPKVSTFAKSEAAGQLMALLDDSDRDVRLAAMGCLAQYLGYCEDALAARFKTMDKAARQRMAEDLASTSENAVRRPRDSMPRVSMARGPMGPEAILQSLGQSPDSAVRDAVNDIILERKLAETGGQSPQGGAGATPAAVAPEPMDSQTSEELARAQADPDPANRLAALDKLARHGQAHGHGRDGGPSDVVLPFLNDPDPGVRKEAGMLLAKSDWLSNARAMGALMKFLATEPSASVRMPAEESFMEVMLVRGQRGDMGLRIAELTRSGNPAERCAGAMLASRLRQRRIFQISKTERSLIARQIEPLLADSSAEVRSAAGQAAGALVDEQDKPDSSATVLEMDALRSEHAEVRVGAMDDVWLLPPDMQESLRRSQYPEVSAAAMLSMEHPLGHPNAITPIVPTAVVVAALTSASQRVRLMAAGSVFRDDPSDPTRQTQGIAALMAASNNPNDAIAIDALDVLVRAYGGKPIGPGTDPTIVKMYSNGAAVLRHPTQQEVAMKRIVDRMLAGPRADRLAAINEYGSGGADTLGCRWDAFKILLSDGDAQVRAAAFGVARSIAAAMPTSGPPRLSAFALPY